MRKLWRRAVKQASFKIWFALLCCQTESHLLWDIWDEQPLFWWTADQQDRQFRLFGARRYFSRLWCVQEVASADSVIVKCGDYEVPWSTYSAYVDHDLILSRRTVSKLPAITKGSEHTFDKVLQCSGLQCSEERDYIYAISSLLRLCEDCPQIQIDYKLDWQTVSTDFARDYVMLNGYTAAWSILTLAAGRRGAELTPSMPSWVPDWRPTFEEIIGRRPLQHPAAERVRKDAATLEQKCRTAGRNITVAFDNCSMRIDLWYCGQLGEDADFKSKLWSGHGKYSVPLRQPLESSDCLYSLPPEYELHGSRTLILRSCAGEKTVFRAMTVVDHRGLVSTDERRSFKAAMHRISII